MDFIVVDISIGGITVFDNKCRFVLITAAILVGIFVTGTLWSNFKPYPIEDWQIDIKSSDWHISQTVSININNFNDSTIANLARYETALIRHAEVGGLRKEDVTKLLSIADKEGPPVKIPVYIKTGTQDNRETFIVVYKYGLGLAGSLSKVKQFMPVSMRLNEEWVVVIRKDDGKIIYSNGTM